MKKDPIVEFAKGFYSILDKDAWGDIDPWLFRDIAKNTPDKDLSDESRESIASLKEAIKAGLERIK